MEWPDSPLLWIVLHLSFRAVLLCRRKGGRHDANPEFPRYRSLQCGGRGAEFPPCGRTSGDGSICLVAPPPGLGRDSRLSAAPPPPPRGVLDGGGRDFP